MTIKHDNPAICSIIFTNEDWEDKLAYDVMEYLKSLPKDTNGKRMAWFDPENKVWKLKKKNGTLSGLLHVKDENRRKLSQFAEGEDNESKAAFE
jgi:hypothetical protein